MNPMDRLRSALGAGNLEGVARLRLGRGVVGNTTYGLYAALAAAAVITVALKDSPWAALTADAGIGVAYLLYLAGTYIFSHAHPDLAMLGDSEWLAYRQAEMASKNNLTLSVLPATSDPLSPPPPNSGLLISPDSEQ